MSNALTQETLLSQIFEIDQLIKKEPDLTEIMVNEDGSIWYEVRGSVHQHEGQIAVTRRTAFIRLLAGHYDTVVNRENPALGVKLPVFHGGRFQALVPPIVSAPVFSIRFPPRKVFGISDLVRSGTLTQEEADLLVQAVLDKKNIVVAGGTGSGKTTLSNALLQTIVDDRVLVIEDNPEIKVAAPNTNYLLTSEHFNTRDAVQVALRLRPDRIIVGELRKGEDAVELLKAWNTGHPGGICTTHASSAASVDDRLYHLMQEVVVTPSVELIEEAVNVVVFIQKVPNENGKFVRKVTDIVVR